MLGMRSSVLGLVTLALALGLSGCSSNDDGNKASDTNNAGTGNGGSGNGSAGSTSTGKAGSKGTPTVTGDVVGDAHEGVYHLGPVDFAETQWHNACAPGTKYRKELQASVGLGGEFIAGVSNAFNDGGGVCDACILIETGMGKSIVARVVTYGVEHADGDIDVSPSVFAAINVSENPRSQTWHFARCPEEGNMQYEFQTGSNPYWTSLWVRNPRMPLAKAEVKTATGKDFVALTRAGDGTLTDASGFGGGAFTLRLTSMDGQVVTEDQPGFKAGALVKSTQQFQ